MSVTLRDVNQEELVKALAYYFKRSNKLREPKEIALVKSAPYKELAPYDPDWFYIRCSALVRHIYFRSPVGVGSVRKIFGGRKKNGSRPPHFCKSAGGIARKALQELEAIKLIELTGEGGRTLTVQGRRLIDRIAATLSKSLSVADVNMRNE